MCHYKEGNIIPGRAVWVLEATHSIFINGPYTERHRKLPALSGEVHATVQITPLLGPYNPADLTVLGVSVVGKDTVSYGKPNSGARTSYL